MVPVTDHLNNFEHWTARRRRFRYLQWRNRLSSSSSSSSSNSYEQFRLFEGLGNRNDIYNNGILGQGSSSSSSASSSSSSTSYSSSTSNSNVAADSIDNEELRILEAGNLYNMNVNNFHGQNEPANPVPEENNYDFNDNNPILEENIPVAVNPDNGDINIHDPDMWLHQLDGNEVATLNLHQEFDEDINTIFFFFFNFQGLNLFNPQVDELIANCPGRRCNIDTFDETTIQQHYCGPCNIECTNCKALHWKLEETTKGKYNKCCRGGEVLLDRVQPPPPFLASLLERRALPNSLVKTFFKKIRWLNTSASFASCK